MSQNNFSILSEARDILVLRNCQSETLDDLRDLDVMNEISEIMKPKSRSNQFSNFNFAPSRAKNPFAKNFQFEESNHGMDPFYEKLKKKSCRSQKSWESLSTNDSD